MDRIWTFFSQHLLIVLSIGGCIFSFFLSFCLKKKGYFLPLSVWLVSTLLLIFLHFEKVTLPYAFATCLLLVAVKALLQFLLVLCIDLFSWRAEKNRKKREEGRALLFTLPDKENDFLRERLQDSLSPENQKNVTVSTSDLQMEYMRKCIFKLKRAKLSPADRLAIENYSRVITAYATKEEFSTQELHGLNDAFSALLKLSAKYAV